jgi:hypothetical protein
MMARAQNLIEFGGFTHDDHVWVFVNYMPYAFTNASVFVSNKQINRVNHMPPLLISTIYCQQGSDG